MFEFYFQSGDFASNDNELTSHVADFLIECFGTLAGAILAFFLYKWQTKSERISKEIADEHMRNTVLFYAFRLIIGANNYSVTLHSALQKSNDNHYLNPLAAVDIEFTPFDDLVRLVERMDQQECVFAYHKQLHNFQISAVFEGFDYINMVRRSIKDIVTTAQVEDNERKKHLRGKIRTLRNELIDSSREVNGDVREIFDKIYDSRFANDDDLLAINETIILPIRLHIKTVLKAAKGRLIFDLVNEIEELCIEIASYNKAKIAELSRIQKQVRNALSYVKVNLVPLRSYVDNLEKSKEFQVSKFSPNVESSNLN
jgi:hypothetical protein